MPVSHFIVILQQLQKDADVMIEVFQADHSHDISGIVSVRIGTFFVSND